VDDTSNWEFAAVVAAICIGLGGLLLFTIVAAIGTWRVHASAAHGAARGTSVGPADVAGDSSYLAEEIREVARMANEATAQLATLSAQVAGLSTQQSLIRERMAELMTQPAIDQRMEAQLSALSETLDALERDIDRLASAPAMGERHDAEGADDGRTHAT
jgi:hypothetical protein